MSLDNMRGSYGRCPPFLVAALLGMCIILIFNWWSLSSQNYDLIKQIGELGEQLKIR
jgi:Na+/melibiose symporter-like transporter